MDGKERLGELIPIIARVIRHWTRHAQDTEDICQNVLLRCFLRLQKPEEIRDLDHYAAMAASNQCCDLARLRRTRLQGEALIGDIEDTREKEPLAKLEEKEQASALLSALNALPSRYREVARRSLLDGCPLRQVAEELGLPFETVKTQKRRAEELLRRWFRLHGPA